MTGKTVLVLGGGEGQLSLMARLRADCHHVILQDRNPACPGRSLADDFVHADTVDAEAASEAARRFRVDAVLTAGTDQPVYAAARAAAARGCPSLHSPDTARAVTDKEVMKDSLSRAGIPVPAFRFAGPDDDERVLNGLRAPFVVKPVDSQGQRGVLRFENARDFPHYRDLALKWSRRGRIVVEEYQQSREITVSGWVFEGRMRIWAVTDRVTREFRPHIGLCLAHRYPSAYAPDRGEEVADLTRRCAAALGIVNGPLYFQFLTTNRGLVVNETAARLGGAYEDLSLPPVCGNDILGLLIAGSLSGAADPENGGFSVGRRFRAFSVPLLFCRPGRVQRNADSGRTSRIPGVSQIRYLLTPGTLVQPLENSVQRAAFAVVHGGTAADVNRKLRRLWPDLGVFDDRGRQMLLNSLGYALNPLAG